MSVLPDAGSELPADTDKAATVQAAPLVEAVENALDVAGLNVGQSWFWTDLEVILPLLIDEHSMFGDFVRPDTVQVIQVYMSTDVRGDDWFLPGVTDGVLLDRRKDLDSHGEEHWERLFFGGNSSVACMSDRSGVLDCPTMMLIGDGSLLAHPTDILVRVNVSDMVLRSGSPGLCSLSILHHGMSEMWHLFGLLSDLPEFPDTSDPDSCLRMLKSQYDFSNVGLNRAMDFSARKMCSRTLMPGFGLKKFAALPVRQEWPVREELAGAEGFTGAEVFDSTEDWSYIKQVTGGESPFCVQPVTGSHLLGSPIGRILNLRQPHLPFGHPSWMIVGDLRFSCILFWWYTMSSGTDLPVVDQAGAAAAATNPLLGTFKGLSLKQTL